MIEATSLSFVWEPTLVELQKLLERQGAFRRVRSWWVEKDDTDELCLKPKSKVRGSSLFQLSAGDNEATLFSGPVRRSPLELIESSGRSVVLYVSDCRSALWRSGAIHDWLRLWSIHEPTVVVQLLPERLWSQTELKVGFKIQVSSLMPGVSNAKLRVHDAPSRRRPLDSQAVTLPVITLTAGALQQWARVVSVAGPQRLPARLFDMSWVKDKQRAARTDWSLLKLQTPEARVELFNATASASARRLARLMSVVPVELPVVHLLQRCFFKEAAEPIHIAEVYDSYLLEPKSTSETDGSVHYEFVSGVRELLNRLNSINETLNVLDEVSKEIAHTLGFQISSFTALLSPQVIGDENKQSTVLPFAKITTQVLRRLGGRYKVLAQQVEIDALLAMDRSDIDISQPEDVDIVIPSPRNLDFLAVEMIDEGASVIDEAEIPVQLTVDKINTANIVVDFEEPGSEDISDLEQFEFIVKTLVRDSAQGTSDSWVTQEQRGSAYRLIQILADSFDLELISIPGGSFTMGSPEKEPERRPSEGPQHEVIIEPFFMGRYPVTQMQWRFIAGLEQVNRKLNPDPSAFKGNSHPVERVSWSAAVEFCDRISRHTGNDYRLPTEAEWEYACRAGTKTSFHFGETISSELANYRGTQTYNGGSIGKYRRETTPVDHFNVANTWGLCDMHGNVWEWCQDYWHDNYYGAPKDGSAWVAKSNSSYRVRRGGSWDFDPQLCRSACRSLSGLPGLPASYNGFRVVCRIPRNSWVPT